LNLPAGRQHLRRPWRLGFINFLNTSLLWHSNLGGTILHATEIPITAGPRGKYGTEPAKTNSGLSTTRQIKEENPM
jgi:hypothetical protein